MPRDKTPGKPKGRVTSCICFVNALRVDFKKRHPDTVIPFGVFSKSCSKRWKIMSAENKEIFQKEAEADKQRYKHEMRAFAPENAKKVKVGGKKKDPNAPKRPVSGFMHFSKDERAKIREINPKYTIGEVSKELARLWAKLDPQTRERYNLICEQDKERYQMEMKEFKKTQVTDADGAEESEEESCELVDLVDEAE